MSDARFPPPKGQTGYRDAGTPVPGEPARPPVPEGPELPRGRRVVARRPDDPEIAIAKAFYPPKRRRAQTSRFGIIAVLFIVLLYIAFSLAMRVKPAPRRVSPPPTQVPRYVE